MTDNPGRKFMEVMSLAADYPSDVANDIGLFIDKYASDKGGPSMAGLESIIAYAQGCMAHSDREERVLRDANLAGGPADPAGDRRLMRDLRPSKIDDVYLNGG